MKKFTSQDISKSKLYKYLASKARNQADLGIKGDY